MAIVWGCSPPKPLAWFPQDHPPYLVLCILSRWPFPYPQKRTDVAGVRRSVLRSRRALPSVLPAPVLPHCPAARGRAGRQTPRVAQPLPLIPHTRKGKSLREGSLPRAVASAAAVTFSLLLVARVPDPCAGCQGSAGPMEKPVKDGILYVQHCKFGKVKGGFGAGYRVCL